MVTFARDRNGLLLPFLRPATQVKTIPFRAVPLRGKCPIEHSYAFTISAEWDISRFYHSARRPSCLKFMLFLPFPRRYCCLSTSAPHPRRLLRWQPILLTTSTPNFTSST